MSRLTIMVTAWSLLALIASFMLPEYEPINWKLGVGNNGQSQSDQEINHLATGVSSY